MSPNLAASVRARLLNFGANDPEPLAAIVARLRLVLEPVLNQVNPC